MSLKQCYPESTQVRLFQDGFHVYPKRTQGSISLTITKELIFRIIFCGDMATNFCLSSPWTRSLMSTVLFTSNCKIISLSLLSIGNARLFVIWPDEINSFGELNYDGFLVCPLIKVCKIRIS